MSIDVALAGFVFCADDWESYDPSYRAELMAAAAGSQRPEDMAQVLRLWDSGPIQPTMFMNTRT